ncbi:MULTISPECIES: hypothetical protein [Streptomyces]|uniref:hypothetical protein n=1 Tax=Streptomyces TaxID=1883 RepID=UPI00227213EA|nr:MULTISPECIES: hypothetical protein [unclassified Streptomyces]MCY0939877.1 hypothetical protein [Streptomyces sp. H34-AA3]MCY0949966.1 hypothetical protein [Streptomyces sp. H27-S2]MCZ4081047.1 hypothetical protein [Streptomyces sp. H34-S5]
MTNPPPGNARHLDSWAKDFIDLLVTEDDVDWALPAAIHGHPELSAETSQRQAHAVHAAAMGLGHAGCAAAAGVSQSLLDRWRTEPAFEQALTAATAMAAANAPRPGQINSYGLRILLRSLARHTPVGAAAATIGLTRRQLERIRRANPTVNSLIEAAILHGRGRPARGPAYRLVHRSDSAPPPAVE